MSRFFLFSKTNTKKYHPFTQQGVFKKLNFRQKMSIFLFILLILLGGFYLFETNDLAIKGFEIKNLEKKSKELGQDNKNLELKITELQSLSNIEELKKELNMIKGGQAEYISSMVSVTSRR